MARPRTQRSRRELRVQPLGTSPILALMTPPAAANITLLAEIDNRGVHPDAGIDLSLYGWLIRFDTGAYAARQVSGSVRMVAAEDAEEALRAMQSWTDHQPAPPRKITIEGETIELPPPPSAEERGAELAAAVRAWRDEGGHDQATAAALLGMSRRTYEGIEAGRGFRYPQLLMLALIAFRSGPPPARPSIMADEADG